MKTIIHFCALSIFFILNSPSSWATDYDHLDQYQYLWTKKQIETKLLFMVKHPEILDYLQIHQDRMEIYSSEEKNNLEYIYYFAPSKKEREIFTLSWEELRVAIDPGHVGGSVGRIEGRYIEMEHDPSITFQEGDLNLYTAWVLEDMLKKKGVTTLMHRDRIGISSFDMSYEEFTQDENEKMRAVNTISRTTEQKEWWVANMNKHLYLLFKKYDFAMRKKKNQAFKPHITISIHYNAYYPHKKTINENGQTVRRDIIGKGNYHMAFIPGSYMRGELSNIKNRQHFLRWLVSGEFENSKLLGHYFMEELARITKIAPIKSYDDLDYFNDYRTDKQKENNTQLNYLKRAAIPLPTHRTSGEFYGVSARNLYTSSFLGAVVLGESFCQESTYADLIKKDITVRGEATSSLVLQVAESYFNAIKHWIEVRLLPQALHE